MKWRNMSQRELEWDKWYENEGGCLQQVEHKTKSKVL